MADVVPKSKRSKMMSGIQGKNTRPEILIRKTLHSRGFRYRLHYKKLIGKPDIVLPKYKVAIQVNGCFWHEHNCHLFKWPSTRADFWKQKISKNRQRDERNQAWYLKSGWRLLTIWECALKGKNRLGFDDLIEKVVQWIFSDIKIEDIVGEQNE